MARQITAVEAHKRIEPGWNRLTALFEGIPEDRVEQPGINGDWSVKQMLGHIAYWERNAARVIGLMADGEPLPPLDPDVINKEVAELDKRRSYAELRQEFEAAHQALLAIIDESGTVDEERLSWDTWDHYPEHIEQLETWRREVGI